MILWWLTCLGDWFVRLFTPLKPIDVARIERNASCPVCGARYGQLRTVVLNQIAEGKPPVKKVFCEHTCLECGARWFENPVVAINPDVVMPAIARSEIEKMEDKQFGVPYTITVSEKVN